jgi:predicted transcriptional regulator
LRDFGRQLKRIQWDIVCRLIVVIHEEPRLKRTRIAMKSGLSYDKCRLYLDWMETMGIIVRDLDDQGHQVIALSVKGKELYFTQCGNIVENIKETVYVS